MNPQNLAPGREQHEQFYSSTVRKDLVQYDYRHTNGELFSCVKPSLEACRIARDKWLSRQEPESQVILHKGMMSTGEQIVGYLYLGEGLDTPHLWCDGHYYLVDPATVERL